MASWDIFCRVVDNFGDAGVCLRLARQLAHDHHCSVRLWIDDLAPLAALVPGASLSSGRQRIDGIEVLRWDAPFPECTVADVIIEAFACDLPESYLLAMSKRQSPPVWINLEYLSAEDWVESCHLGRSPQAAGMTSKTFFFPGFTERTGGLLRENDLPFGRAREQTAAALPVPESLVRERLVPNRLAPNELLVSMFCYANPRLAGWLEAWADGDEPLRLIVPPGPAVAEISRWLGQPLHPRDHVSVRALSIDLIPFLSQWDYDDLLGWCDVNFVRGEDSFVRAQWACRPFVWQAYPQADAAHHAKIDAFLRRYLEDAPCELAESIQVAWRFWNGFGDPADPARAWSAFRSNGREIGRWGKVWADRLDRAGDLANNLVRFAAERAG